ncbi:acetylglutamate kinase [Facilibium subflavum]|uniref:acetylglutamate kinase n=1 Tax=Facilibium subflavum TaxID=2219058 RepID=UPI000E64D857|nr:acetylglutamate kinase [Facilibium subflavum]
MMQYDKTVVLKIGGKVLDNEAQVQALLSAFSEVKANKVIVHGGGSHVDRILKALSIEPKFINGRRITDKKTLEVVAMVLNGQINAQIVANLNANNTKSLGLSGVDCGLVRSIKRARKTHDFGFVGDVVDVDASFLQTLFYQGVIPVIAPLSCDKAGQLLNVNADTVACEIASALAKQYKHQVRLLYCFDLAGVYQNISEPESLFSALSFDDYIGYKDQGVITDGMIPKLENCFNALNNKVKEVYLSNTDGIIAQLAGLPQKSGTFLRGINHDNV